MEKIVEQGMLYDFYGELLTERQKKIYESFVFENLSLSEIAGEEGVSRQAVHDIIRRCDRILLDYENKLKLVEKFQIIKAQIRNMDDLIQTVSYDPGEDISQVKDKLLSMTTEILQNL